MDEKERNAMKTTKKLSKVLSLEYPEDLLHPKPDPEKAQAFFEGMKREILNFIDEQKDNQG